MTCPACGASTRDGARFCGTCGAGLTHACPACGAAQAADVRFCEACGAAQHLRARPIGRTALEGERKLVTVLFADLKNSTELLSNRDPEDARRIIDPVLQLMIDAVHAYDGMVNQVMGDGIMALFGAPVAHEDHAARACYAALRIQAAAARHSAALAAAGEPDVLIRVGINSGDVLVRSISSDVDMDYTAVGETTHIASRLEQLAAPGTILCAASTQRLAEGLFDVRARGALTLRGVRQPVEAVEVLDARPGRSRFEAAVARGLAPFVGRADELRALGSAVDGALEGRPGIVGLVGEPGVGKSRLVWEFVQSRADRGWLVLKRAAASHGSETPYLPVIELLRAHFGLEPGARASTIEERVTARLRALDPALGPSLPALLALLDPDPRDPDWLALEPVRRRQETNDAITQLLLRLAHAQPVLVVLEDLHWADHESRALLDWVIAGAGHARLAILVTYRPEYRPSWSSRTPHTQIRLEPLPRPAAQALLDALVGHDRSLASLKTRVLEHTAGNPFFLEETVRTLVESGVVAGEPGGLRLQRAPDPTLVPASIHAVLAARIDRLPDDDKSLLQEAAAIGAVVADDVLRAVSARSPEAYRAGIARLRDAEFLHGFGLYPEILYVFTHALTREVTYSTMVAERRRDLHARIHAALEQLHGEQRSDHLEQLADHALRGELWSDAMRHSREAAERAAARSAYREAAAHLKRALVALGRLPATAELSAEAIDIRFQLRNALFPLGDIAGDLENLREAERLAQELGDERRLAWVWTYMTRDLSILGHADEAGEAGRRAWALASKVGGLELEVLAQGYLGAVCFAGGGYREAVAMLGPAMQRLEGPLALQRFGLPGPASVFFRVWLVSSLVRLGQFAEARALARSGLEIAAAAEQPLARVVALYVSGYAAVHEGDLDRGIPELETSLAQCREWNVPGWFSNIASALGYAYALRGRLAEGEPLIRQALEQAAATGSMMNHAAGVACLAEGLLLAGRLDEAREHAERALDFARKHRERGNEAIALFLLGEAAWECGDRETGVAFHREALRLAEELGMQPLTTRCAARLQLSRTPGTGVSRA